jgi:nitrite reductase/ring-hydroxylating ferredoxin subunit
MPDPNLSSSTATTRRTVLRAAGLAALSGGGVAVLGACSPAADTTGPTSSAPATSAPASSPPASPTPASSSPTAKSSPAASKSAAAPSGPSVAASEVPVGGGVILEDANYVITQPTAGEFKAFTKICTHMQCVLGSVAGGTINCPCHGSKFSIEDGSAVNPPATEPLEEFDVTVAGGQVVVDA